MPKTLKEIFYTLDGLNESIRWYSEAEILKAIDNVCSIDKICLLRKELG
jgi:hypothetical protein